MTFALTSGGVAACSAASACCGDCGDPRRRREAFPPSSRRCTFQLPPGRDTLTPRGNRGNMVGTPPAACERS